MQHIIRNQIDSFVILSDDYYLLLAGSAFLATDALELETASSSVLCVSNEFDFVLNTTPTLVCIQNCCLVKIPKKVRFKMLVILFLLTSSFRG